MYTDDNGIVRFESTDNIAPLQVGLNTALESVSDVISSVKERFGDLDADNIVEGTLDVDRRWEGAPFAMASGTITMEGVGLSNFDLPAGRFTRTPNIVISGNESIQSPTQDVRAWATSTTRFSVRYQRADDWSASHSGSRSFTWIAIQMTPTSASG